MAGVRVRQLVAELLGTALLLATVVGSGIMGASLSPDSDAIALLGNTIATGAVLVVLILMFGPISGAHFNPAVTLGFLLRREISATLAAQFWLVQVIGAVLGVWAAHLMFDLSIWQLSSKPRTGIGQWFAEGVATFGLMATILMVRVSRADAVAMAVGLYITAGYWFTASTSFANPAVTIARGFTDTFAGIEPGGVPAFVTAQLIGAVLAVAVCGWLLKR